MKRKKAEKKYIKIKKIIQYIGFIIPLSVSTGYKRRKLTAHCVVYSRRLNRT